MGQPPTWACWRMVGRCKAQFQRGSLLVGRRSSATPVPTEYCLGYNLPWWAPSSSCSSASATALDMAVAILMWCSSGWCSIPCSCIGSYLSSLVVDACYSRVCRLSSCLVSIIGVLAMIWFTCGCSGCIVMLLDLLNWPVVFVLGRWWSTCQTQVVWSMEFSKTETELVEFSLNFRGMISESSSLQRF